MPRRRVSVVQLARDLREAERDLSAAAKAFREARRIRDLARARLFVAIPNPRKASA